MRAYFVTGTDTGVGKTTVATALLAAATRRGLRTACMKPAESGCLVDTNGRLIAQDAEALRAASSLRQELDDVCPYRFADPVAPGVAAAQQGVLIDFARIARAFQVCIAQHPDLVLVEGAGGLLVPYGQGRMAADLAQHLDLPLLIIARPTLGTINHTLLTIEAATSRGLAVAGIVFSSQSRIADEPAVASNAREIVAASGVPYLGCLPLLDGPTLPAMADAAEQSIDVTRLLEHAPH